MPAPLNDCDSATSAVLRLIRGGTRSFGEAPAGCSMRVLSRSPDRKRALCLAQVVRSEDTAEVEWCVSGNGALALHILKYPLQTDVRHVQSRIEDTKFGRGLERAGHEVWRRF